MAESPAAFLQQCRERVDRALKVHFGALPESPLRRAMEYAVFNGGKRVRPALCYAAAGIAEDAGGDTDRAACALELIHAYSLVHDDLPAMDDDDLRRGRATCHIAFDEATAILAGDGLQAMAFQVVAESERNAGPVTALLARAAGPAGMVLGQNIDLEAIDTDLTEADLEQMHRLKTGALITASVIAGGMSSGLGPGPESDALRRFGDALGLAFQVKDDILDVEAGTEVLGKRQGADSRRNKPTYTSLLGLEGAKQRLHGLRNEGLAALEPLGDRAQPLRQLADFIVDRGS